MWPSLDLSLATQKCSGLWTLKQDSCKGIDVLTYAWHCWYGPLGLCASETSSCNTSQINLKDTEMTGVMSYCKPLPTLVLVSSQGKSEIVPAPDIIFHTRRFDLTRQTSADKAQSFFPHKNPPLASFLSDGCHFSPVTGWHQCLLMRKHIFNNMVIITNSPSFICSYFQALHFLFIWCSPRRS